jgi:hypothetical protein
VPFPELVEHDGRWLKMQSDAGSIHSGVKLFECSGFSGAGNAA